MSNNGISGVNGWLSELSVADANNIWVVGHESKIFKSTDGGNNWINKNPDNIDFGDFYCTSFLAVATGIICGDNGIMYFTNNDGTNWTNRQNKISDGNTGFLSFSDANHGCWVANEALCRTTDGGNTWANQPSGQIQYLQMFPDGSGIRRLATDAFETTSDQGANWTANGGSHSGSYFAFANINVGFYEASGNISYKTTNGGVNWTETSRPYTDILQGVSVPDQNTIWILEWGYGQLTRSVDGGATWAYTSGSANGYGGTVYARDANVAWVGRDNGKLFKTTNGGNNWTEIDPQVNGNEIRDIVFLTNDSAIVVAKNGYYSISTDGGNSWAANDIAGSNLNKIGIASHSNYFLGGDNGTLIQRHKVTGPSDVEDYAFDKTGYVLHQNCPNPFNSNTTIEFELPVKANVSVIIFDFLGREVSTLLSGELCSGIHKVEWDAKTQPGGIYICRMQVGGQSLSKKLVLMK